jgi:hypothetical protein
MERSETHQNILIDLFNAFQVTNRQDPGMVLGRFWQFGSIHPRFETQAWIFPATGTERFVL